MLQPTAHARSAAPPPLTSAEREARVQQIAALADRNRSLYLAASWRILRDPVEAEDAVQDALTSACRKVDGFRDESQLSTWLYRIVINASLMRLRSKRRRPEAELEAIPESQLAPHPHHDDVVARQELAGVLMRCADSLPSAQRDLLLARYLDEVPLRSIARDLDITEGGVKARLHRARAALRAAFFAALGPEPA